MYLRGAHVTSFKVSGVEWMGMRADAKLDGSKQNISGGRLPGTASQATERKTPKKGI